jgi:hypothetical protein
VAPRQLTVSRELPVDPYCDHRWDFSCCLWSPLLACRRQYPGRSDGIYSLVRFHSLRPSHEPGRVGSCIVGFGACSAFTHVTACTLAKSPSDSLHQRLQQLRCLHCCSDCYRVERTSSRAGYSRCGPPPFHDAPGYATIRPVNIFRLVAFNDSSVQACAVSRSGTSSVTTLKCRKFAVPKDVVSATSDASRPTAIKTRPMRG